MIHWLIHDKGSDESSDRFGPFSSKESAEAWVAEVHPEWVPNEFTILAASTGAEAPLDAEGNPWEE